MNHRLNRTIRAVIVSAACSVVVPALAQTAPDNTKVNTRDRAKGAVTADQQKETAADRDVAKRIRQSVVKDKSLSTYAHNVKIVVQGGQVTLKGPVRTEGEKQSIVAKATEVAGDGRITDEIAVMPSTTKTPKRDQ